MPSTVNPREERRARLSRKSQASVVQPGGHRGRVEVQDDILAAQCGERDTTAVVAGKCEVRAVNPASSRADAGGFCAAEATDGLMSDMIISLLFFGFQVPIPSENKRHHTRLCVCTVR